VKPAGTLPVALCSAFAFACSGGGTGSAAGDPDGRISTVQAALIGPTGTVSSATAKTLLSSWQAYQRVHGAFEALMFIGSDAGQPCLAGSREAGAYDLSCLTLGQVQGRLTFESHGSATDAGFEGRVDAKLENACVGNACVNADALVDIVPSKGCAPLATVVVTAAVTWSGGSAALSFGAQGGIGRGELMPRIAYFDTDEHSLVVDGEGGLDTPGPYLVSGSNRSFECTFLDASGHCDGPTSFTF
jgi:hypothetical protein